MIVHTCGLTNQSLVDGEGREGDRRGGKEEEVGGGRGNADSTITTHLSLIFKNNVDSAAVW